MSRFIHIGFAFPGAAKTKVLEPVVSQAGDWIRYSASAWIVWTDKNPDQIYNLLAPHLTTHEQVLIAYLDLPSGYQGWMPKWVWDWISGKLNPLNLGAFGLPSALPPYGFGALNSPPNSLLPRKK